MELVCLSKHLDVALSTALDVTGREHLVVVAKATWRIPEPGQRPRPLSPCPLVVSDEYYGAPGESAMRYGDDFVRHKPRCDLLFDACAHAPDQRPLKYLEAEVRIGAWHKTVCVTGNRQWQRGVLGLTPSEPAPFTTLPLHHGHAFGGMRHYQDGKHVHCEAFEHNLAGIGWGGPKTWHTLAGEPIANLHAPGKPIKKPNDDALMPTALSAIARHWAPRNQYGGTYDDAWRRELAPFLPEDFDERFFQCAPTDQQIPYPAGGETVTLTHLLPRHPTLSFTLPRFDALRVRILRTDYSTEILSPPVDTLFFETEAGRFSAVWRASTPIRRRIHEFDTVAVGNVDPAWWDARRLGLDGVGCPGCGQVQEAA
ncbi:DUF2169 family type VI secretion system accessory protein [Thauera butanivorans]|uniref:DUF2169 family type VI secretion system accessory protein n=1 Tax=Thauera butanivorans TaxID=86174 RepID=UPI0008386599|nr:DUF2169 domain-containing protein [Thauera butanivorans]